MEDARIVQLIDFIYHSGAQGRNRTTDTAIFSRMLYQLSYLGAALARRARLIESGACLVQTPSFSSRPLILGGSSRLARLRAFA